MKDFKELVQVYLHKRPASERGHNVVADDFENASDCSSSTTSDGIDGGMEDDYFDELDGEVDSLEKSGFGASEGRKLSVEYLEDDFDDIQAADDFDGRAV